jgi:DNA-3-methyladenine glycosylase I
MNKEEKQKITAERCPWCAGDPLYIRYHDGEWGVPVHDELRHFEFLILEGAQAGLSWLTVLKKREAYRSAFSGFDPQKVSRYSDKKIEELLGDSGIIRNRRKIQSAVKNARCFLDIQKEAGSFDAYIWSFTGGAPIINSFRTLEEIPAQTALSAEISKDLKKRGFSFVGPTIIYAHMQAIGMVNDHLISCFRYQELGGQPDH